MANVSVDNTQNGARYNGKVWYSPNVIRSVTLGLMDMFNDIKVRRFESDFITIIKEIEVPLHFSPKTKEYYERKEDYSSNGGNRYYQQVPAMALVFTGMNYAPSRAVSPNETRMFPFPVDESVDPDYFKDYQPTPYDYTYELRIRAESMADYIQIIEQILPYFNPSLTIRMKEIPFLDIARNLKVNMDATGVTMPEEMSGTDMNQIDGVLNLTVEGWLYRPITNGQFLKELYKYLSVMETDVGVTLDRRIRTLMEFHVEDIPANAINKRQTIHGYWLYDLVDQSND